MSDWTQEDFAALDAMWPLNELTSAEIGQRIGKSKNAVIGMARRRGLGLRERSRITLRSDFGAEQVEEAKRMRLAGVMLQTIATKFGVSEKTIRTRLEGVRPLHTAERRSLPRLKFLTPAETKEAHVKPAVHAFIGTLSRRETCQRVLSETGLGRTPIMCGEPAVLRREGAVWCANCRAKVYRRAQADELV